MHILLADDHPLFAEALQSLFERTISGSRVTVVVNLAGAHRVLAADGTVKLAILDLHMPDAQGLDGLRRTLERFPTLPVVVISGDTSRGIVTESLALGARGFLPKTLPIGAFPAALQVVLSGGTYVPAEYAAPAAADSANGVRPEPAGAVLSLTPRETEVLELLALGQSNKEIGRTLGMQEVTVKLHARNIFRKLGVRNRVEASNAARRLGLSVAAAVRD